MAGRAVGQAAFEDARYVDAKARPDVARKEEEPVTGAHLSVIAVTTSGRAKVIKACPSFGVRQGRVDCARAWAGIHMASVAPIHMRVVRRAMSVALWKADGRDGLGCDTFAAPGKA
jgi:hypothetical protein